MRGLPPLKENSDTTEKREARTYQLFSLLSSLFPPCRLETHRAENRAGELQLRDFGEQVELLRNRLTVWDGWADQPVPLGLVE